MTTELCEVLIVGAGPVGMLLAVLLHDQGVRVKIVERQQALYPLPRAVAFDHESRRLFGIAGLTDEVASIVEERNLKGGEDGQNFVWRDADLKMVVDLHSEAPTRSGFPFGNNFHQPTLEKLLEKTVLARGIDIIRGYALTATTQKVDRVEAEFCEFHAAPATAAAGVAINGIVTASKTNGSAVPCAVPGTVDADASPAMRISAQYLIGCDGANSTVRRLEGFTQTHREFENDWLVLDLLLRDGYVPPLVERIGAAQICDPSRPTTCIFAGKGRRRFEFMRLPGEKREHLLQDDVLWGCLEKYGFSPDNVDLERKVVYTFNAKWCNEFYRGRVALAGDALHLMPPFIGQGLNSGFRDAGALAWRLPLMLRGQANPTTVLQSYQDERIAHIRHLTEYCVTLGEVVCETDPVRSKELHTTLRNKPPGRRYDPPLGRPGTFTEQPEAGKLSLHRRLAEGNEQPWFDAIHGYGWVLLSLGRSTEESLTGEAREFFLDTLKGKCVAISDAEDFHGEYTAWFKEFLAPTDVVLIRPDFYVFGHAPVAEASGLVDQLRAKISE